MTLEDDTSQGADPIFVFIHVLTFLIISEFNTILIYFVLFW